MGYKTLCLECRKTYNHGSNFEKFHIGNCPECGKLMLEVDQKFKSPFVQYPENLRDAKEFVVKYSEQALK